MKIKADYDIIWEERECTVSSFEEFVKEVGEILTRNGENLIEQFWFRGQSNAEWDLSPSFLRITGLLGLTPQQAIELEIAAQNQFKHKAHLYANAALMEKVKTFPCWWAVMQHHGAPTRLLDWSMSPYVAAYFAVQQDGSGKPGAVWCVCRNHLESSFMKSYVDEFPDFTREEELDEKVRTLHKRLQDPETIHAVAPLNFKFATSERIAQQQGAFTMCLRIHQSHNCISKQVGAENVKRILIPHELKPEFLSQLRLMNITASSLFPGVDGLGQSIAEFAALGVGYKAACGFNA